MKLSGYHKEFVGRVELLTDYSRIEEYDKVFISKVFTDTPMDDGILKMPNVEYGGTGFFYDKAPPLPSAIEHHMPDYHLYDDFIKDSILSGAKKQDFKYYMDYSIGFLTRGCFRKCPFCVNQNYDRVRLHSPLKEFMDPDRKKICMLDDNILGSPDWKRLLEELIDTGKPFRFQQGMDERILTDEKCKVLFSAKYDGDMTFAFDNVADYDLIKEKLKLIRKYSNKQVRFYVLCGFDRNGKYDAVFWRQDIYDLFKRIGLLMQYKCVPYIMRFNKYEESPYSGAYITIARWCNQPSFFKKLSLNDFAEVRNGKRKESADNRRITQLRNDFPDLAKEYFDLKF